MTKIKICGLTRKEDIDYVNELLPDYVGFVFAKSKRQITSEKAKKLIDLLDKRIKTVGVFVNEDSGKVASIAEYLKLNVLQFHGLEDEDYIKEFKNISVWKSVNVEVQDNALCKIEQYEKKIRRIEKYNIEGILLDSSIKGVLGGTGVSFNWNVIQKNSINKPLILAGGLNVQNVQKAMEILNPFVVDVSSSVEESGVKNFTKIKDFIEKVRSF